VIVPADVILRIDVSEANEKSPFILTVEVPLAISETKEALLTKDF
jgi:hypothetical protein